jgi:enoyl-CoA hydratase/carnithine racemase
MTHDRERSLVRVALPAGDPARDGVALVTLDRREARNALSFALLADLDEVLAVLDDDESCRAIVITGAGERAFAAGADIRDLASSTREQLRRDDPFAAVDRVGRLRTPVIAAVRGYALGGGCELAMACDIVVAGDDAVFGQPELSIGVIPGAGGTQRLSRLVGPSNAKDIVFTGRQVRADEALRIGLVDRVVPAAQVYDVALAWASEFTTAAALALRAAKESIDRGLEVDLQTGLEIERQQFAALFATEDRTTGMRSFVEHGPGKAEFQGR